ncbi:cardiolipin synthase [Aquimarina addita]|uniref:Cardiolipin synthase n=1 Tax=Aquimarina addita TaxID=870485 RepID=A0ABP7X8P8_9FLAO
MTAFTIISTLYLLITILAIFTIILYGSRAAKSLSWILVIIVLPFIGVILYLIFGINRRRFKFFKLKAQVKRQLYDANYKDKSTAEKQVTFNSKKSEKLAQLIRNSSDFSARSGNKINVLQTGKEAFETIFKAFENAEHFIHLQYYIFEEGDIMDQLLTLFKKKVEEGVEIRILYDAIGSFELNRRTINKFRDIGVEIHSILPLRFGSFLFTLNYRNHRKIAIIDGNIGFTGGVNISDKYLRSISDLGIWDDTHLFIEGPAVDCLHRIFIKDYYFASNEHLLLTKKYLPAIEPAGDIFLQIVSSGPDSRHPTIMQQYITMINLAEKSIYISNPYFIPNSAMMEALRIAALSGVQIKLLVPEKSDSWLAKYSMLSHFEELLSLGAGIYLQQSAFLHSKLIVMDREIASIGSGNFDHRSFEHNFETNALIYNSEVAEDICQNFEKDCDEGLALDYKTYQQRSLKRKLSEGIARFFSPLL